MSVSEGVTEIVEAEGHLVDSQILNHVFDKVIERDGQFEVVSFSLGRTNNDFSKLELKVTAKNEAALQVLLQDLMSLGCYPRKTSEIRLRQATETGVVPHDFYSTTNHHTLLRHEGRWIEVKKQRMDAVIRVTHDQASCVKLRDVRKGDLIVCGVEGIKVSPEFQERDRLGFAFMTNDVSTERRVEVSVSKVVAMINDVKKRNGRIAVVAGPVVIHSGGVSYLEDLIKKGFVDVLLAGNALAVHDVEHALYGTSLGIDLEAGVAAAEGHKNHMRAINAVNEAGGLREAVESGILKSGVMYETIKKKIPYVLAGSIRDDGPLKDTCMDLIEAQNLYSEALENVSLVIMLSTMLHSIGVGNMLSSRVRVVCVDINPAVVTKLSDRGSSQTVGIVTDVGLFLHQLAMQVGEEYGLSQSS